MGPSPAVDDVAGLSHAEFQELVVGYLGRQGYATVEAVAGARDCGGDLRCRDARGRLVLVHVRRYPPAVKVGSLTIRQLDAMMARHLAVRGVCVTTSAFTAPARAMSANLGVDLVDGDDLAAYHRSVNPAPRRTPAAAKTPAPGGQHRPGLRSWPARAWRKVRGG